MLLSSLVGYIMSFIFSRVYYVRIQLSNRWLCHCGRITNPPNPGLHEILRSQITQKDNFFITRLFPELVIIKYFCTRISSIVQCSYS
jgi:hypothetical protein